MAKKQWVFVVVGPTGVGKSACSVRLAKHWDAEIVSADARQLYAGLDKGTAKPTLKTREAVTHHLVDAYALPALVSAGSFARAAIQALHKIFEKKDHAVLVGGSGLYVRAVCEGLSHMPAIPPAVRQKWRSLHEAGDLNTIRAYVRLRDPQYYANVDVHNFSRLLRAAEVIETSGKPYSFYRQGGSGIESCFQYLKIGLHMDREALYKKISERVEAMLADGLWEEARQLYDSHAGNIPPTIGYQELFGYFDKRYDKAEAQRLLLRNTKRYAKRQLTFFRKDPSIRWFSPEDEAGILSYLSRCITS